MTGWDINLGEEIWFSLSRNDLGTEEQGQFNGSGAGSLGKINLRER